MTKTFDYISLFAGIGGFDTALNNLGGQAVFASEIDNFATQSFSILYGDDHLNGDVTKVEAVDVPNHHVLVGGFPCFVEGTMVLTKEGYVPIECVDSSMEVYTHKNRFRKVNVTMMKKAKGSVVLSTISHAQPTITTPEHPYYVLERGTDTPKWVEAKDLDKEKHLLALPKYVVPPSNRSDHVITDRQAYIFGRSIAFDLPISDADVLVALNRLVSTYGLHSGIFKLPLDKQKIIIDGIVGEEIKNGVNYVVTIKNKALAMSVVQLIRGVYETNAEVEWDDETGDLTGEYQITFNTEHTNTDGITTDEFLFTPIQTLRTFDDENIVYNLEVDEDNSYTADGPVVHNCQAFSGVGLQRGFEDSRGTLFFEIARIAKEKRPNVMLLENVKGLVTHDKGKTLDVIIKALCEIGYRVDFEVLNTLNFGLPHNRERIFIVAVREDLIESSEWYTDDDKVIARTKKRLMQDDAVKPFNFGFPKGSTDIATNLEEFMVDNESIKESEFYTKSPTKLLLDLTNNVQLQSYLKQYVEPYNQQYDDESYLYPVNRNGKLDFNQAKGNKYTSPGAIIEHVVSTNTFSFKNDELYFEAVENSDLVIHHPYIISVAPHMFVVAKRDLSQSVLTYFDQDKEQFFTVETLGPEDTQHLYPKSEVERKGYRAPNDVLALSLEQFTPIGTTINYYRKRVNTKGYVQTLTTRLDSSRTAVIFVTKDFSIRRIDVREAWRLQGFSDEQFDKVAEHISVSQMKKQAGNAVSVPVIEAIASRLIQFT